MNYFAFFNNFQSHNKPSVNLSHQKDFAKFSFTQSTNNFKIIDPHFSMYIIILTTFRFWSKECRRWLWRDSANSWMINRRHTCDIFSITSLRNILIMWISIYSFEFLLLNIVFLLRGCWVISIVKRNMRCSVSFELFLRSMSVNGSTFIISLYWCVQLTW